MIGLLNNGMRGYCFDQITLSFNEKEQYERNSYFKNDYNFNAC